MGSGPILAAKNGAWHHFSTAAAGVLVLLACGCGPDAAEISTEVLAPAAATPQYFHGNCFAGFRVAVDLRVMETEGVDVLLDSLSYRLTDRASGELLVEESLDRTAIRERHGEAASLLAGRSALTLTLTLSGPTATRPVGPLGVTGEIAGDDEDGDRARASFDDSVELLVSDPEPPKPGACAALGPW